MSDDDWITQLMAAAKPLEVNRAVRLIVLENYDAALRLCRILSLRGADSTPLQEDIARSLQPGDARFVAGLCARGETAGSLAGIFFRDNRGGERHARAYFFFGPRAAITLMQESTSEIHQSYRQAMAEEGAFLVDRNPNN